MSKQCHLLRNLSYLIISMGICCLCQFSYAESVASSDNLCSNRLIRVSNADLKRDMIYILDMHKDNSLTGVNLSNKVKTFFNREPPSLSTSEVELAITFLKQFKNSEDVSPSCSARAEGLLIALGDWQEITNAVQRLSAKRLGQINKARSDLLKSEQPKVITVLERSLFRDEKLLPKRISEDSFVSPESFEASQIILKILITCGEFPASVCAWAKETERVEYGKRRDLVRQWWTQNRDALREERFNATLPPKAHADN